MRVRVIVCLENCALVRHLVHATRHEPVELDAAQGMMAFDVDYGQVEIMLNRLAQTGVGYFQAHLARIPK